MSIESKKPDVTRMEYEERKNYQHTPVVNACKTLIEVSHKHIPEGSRICRLDIILDVPNRKRSIILDYSPAIKLYVDNEGSLTYSLKK